ncbi:MAG TPA: class I SAM-dependent methyltransferase [Ktedonobacteraceae bacterium]|nr:class I SAM-dependent methyltransferase [Ktedonobacteraceae bacterium]
MGEAVERWQAMLDARARQMDAAYAQSGRTSADFWDRRACGYHRATKETTQSDPFFRRVSGEVTPQTTVLDVGAGTGRFSLALAPLVLRVTAVEPNTSMLSFLQQDAQQAGFTNISYLQSGWQDAPDELRADVVICSHVLYPIRDIEPFLAKLLKAADRTCYIYHRATSIDSLTAPIWRHFHGDERREPPAYIHVLDILFEMGVYADVEVVRIPPSLRYPSLDVAVRELQEQLILPGDEQTSQELRALLQDWLVERDGLFVPPVGDMVAAIIKISSR